MLYMRMADPFEANRFYKKRDTDESRPHIRGKSLQLLVHDRVQRLNRPTH